MALKENYEEIKKSINSEEQFLESLIKSERFLKKYKRWFVIVTIIIIAGISGYYGSQYIEQKRLNDANEAYLKLLKNPNDDKAKSDLKSKDINLYTLFELQESYKNKNIDLNSLSSQDIDPLLASIIKFQSGDKDTGILQDYSLVLKAYEYLKNNEIKKANEEFAKIPRDSALAPIVKNLQHYGLEK